MTENNTSTEVAAATQSAVPAVPNAAKVGGFGSDLSQDDFQIPRAKIVTFTSKEVKAPNEADRIPAGRFINSVSKKEISKEFIPLKVYKNYVQWNPMTKDDPNYDPAFELGERIFMSTDRSDPRVVEGIKFVDGKKPKVSQVLNYLCYFPGQNFPLILSFKSTSFKAGKALNTMLAEAGVDDGITNRKMFEFKFKINFTLESKGGNDYYVANVAAGGLATPEELNICEKLFERFANKDIEAMAHQDDVTSSDQG